MYWEESWRGGERGYEVSMRRHLRTWDTRVVLGDVQAVSQQTALVRGLELWAEQLLSGQVPTCGNCDLSPAMDWREDPLPWIGPPLLGRAGIGAEMLLAAVPMGVGQDDQL